MSYRVVFMGSPGFAVPVLHALIEAPNFEVVGVVTQPDRPAGRGSELRPPAVKIAALKAGIDIYQPEKLRGEAAYTHLKNWQADVHVVAAYGQILKQEILDIPRAGSINVHASLLPRWRGAAPIQAAIRAGDSETGITIMKMDVGLDTGPMLISEAVSIDPRETAQTLHDKLAAISGSLLLKALRGYLSGDILPRAQDESLVTYAPQIKKEEGLIDWSQSAVEIDRHVRAFTPWPGTFTYWNGTLLKIISGQPLPGNFTPGQVTHGTSDHPILIGTGSGAYAPIMLQLAGKKQISATDFLNGNADLIGVQLGRE